MRGWCLSVLAAAVGLALLPSPASAGVASQSFGYTGAEQAFHVPSGVSSVTVIGAGAAGGTAGAAGGLGDDVAGTVSVTAGSTLFVEVGAAGCNGGAPGVGGAGAGGGATDVRTVSIGGTAFCGGSQSGASLSSRLLVAAGGGGGGTAGLLVGAFGGGAAGQPGGGAGGGGAGTSSTGGVGRDGGAPGSFGSGGAGGSGNLFAGAGGGGGGGLYGGGGGGAGGGGGGGSNLIPAGGASGTALGPPGVAITYQQAAHTLSLSLSRTQLVANGADSTVATVTEVDVNGNPVAENPPTITASDRGVTVSAVSEVGGSGTYTATLTASTHAGQVTVTAADPVSHASAQATFTQVAGPAASMKATLNPSSIRADGSSTSNVTVTVSDAHGNAKPGESVMLTSSDPGDQLSPVTDAGNGTYTATVRSSTQVHAVTITATDGSLQATATLNQSGVPATISVALTPTQIVANGKSTATVTATVSDASSNPVSGERVTFTSSDPGIGVGQVTDHGNGTYTATLKSSRTAQQATVTAHDGALSASAGLTETSPSTTPPGSSTAVFKGALGAGSHGALVVLSCTAGANGAPCGGTLSLTLTRGGRIVTLGQTTFTIRPGRSATVVTPLSKHGRSVLRRHHGRLTVALRMGGTLVRRVQLIAT